MDCGRLAGGLLNLTSCLTQSQRDRTEVTDEARWEVFAAGGQFYTDGFNSLAGHGAEHRVRCWGRLAIALGRPTMVDGADSASSGEEKWQADVSSRCRPCKLTLAW